MVKVNTQGRDSNGNRRISDSLKNRKMMIHAALIPDTKVNSMKNTDVMNVIVRTIRAGQIAFIMPIIDISPQHRPMR